MVLKKKSVEETLKARRANTRDPEVQTPVQVHYTTQDLNKTLLGFPEAALHPMFFEPS